MQINAGKMKVTDRSPERLRLTYRQWHPGAAIALMGVLLLYISVEKLSYGAVFEGIAVLLFLALPAFGVSIAILRPVTLVLDGALGVVHVHNGPMWRRTVRSAPLAMLHGAEEDTDPNTDLGQKRVLLRFEDRPSWPVTNRSFTGDAPRRAATVINTWLASHTAPSPIDSTPPNA